MRRPAVSLNRRNTHPNRSRRGHWRSERDWPGTTEDLRTWILSSVSKRNTPIRQPGTKNRSPSLPNCHRSPYPQERCGSLPGTSEPVVVPGLTASMPKSNAGSRTSFVSASIAPRPRVSIWPTHWQTSVLATRRRPPPARRRHETDYFWARAGRSNASDCATDPQNRDAGWPSRSTLIDPSSSDKCTSPTWPPAASQPFRKPLKRWPRAGAAARPSFSATPTAAGLVSTKSVPFLAPKPNAGWTLSPHLAGAGRLSLSQGRGALLHLVLTQPWQRLSPRPGFHKSKNHWPAPRRRLRLGHPRSRGLIAPGCPQRPCRPSP